MTASHAKPRFRYYCDATRRYYRKLHSARTDAKSCGKEWKIYKVYDDGTKILFREGKPSGPQRQQRVGYLENHIYAFCERCGVVNKLERWKWNWETKRRCAECKSSLLLIPPVKKGNWQYLGFKSYYDYLRSNLWKQIRERVLTRDKRKCQTCGGNANQVHHKSYHIDVLRGDNIAPLVAICATCHADIEYSQEGTKQRVDQANAEMKRKQAFRSTS